MSSITDRTIDEWILVTDVSGTVSVQATLGILPTSAQNPKRSEFSMLQPPRTERTRMRHQNNECRTEQQLQWLQNEVQRQGRELDAVESTLREQKRSLEALKTQLAVVMGSWQSEVRRDLGKLIREIDSANDTRKQWEQLRQQVETASPDFALHAAEAGADLTPYESKVWMLMGMKLTSSEIATVLQQPVVSVTECCRRISQKLQRAGDEMLSGTDAAGDEPATMKTPRRQATARGRR